MSNSADGPCSTDPEWRLDRPLMETHSSNVLFAMLTCLDERSFHGEFVVGKIAGSNDKVIMYYMNGRDLTAETMARLAKTMRDCTINKLILVVDEEITPYAQNCLQELKPWYHVEVVQV